MLPRFSRISSLVVLVPFISLADTFVVGPLTISSIPSSGTAAVAAYGVNNTGQIVGSQTVNAIQNGFLLSSGIRTTYDASGTAAGSYGEGINNQGQIVGLNLATGNGFLFSGGAFTAITYPGADAGSTNAAGIDDLGRIVGSYKIAGVMHGFVLANGAYLPVDFPGASSTAASGINNNGQIVGWYTANGVTSGYLLSGGTYINISMGGAHFTKALGINLAGEVVGQADAGGFLWNGGGFTLVAVPGSSSTAAYGINDAGQIVGTYALGGQTFGFSAAQNTVLLSVREYPTGPNTGAVGPITAGSDGGLWFTVNPPGSNHANVGRMSTTGATVQYIVAVSGLSDTGITAGPDGAVWFPYFQGSCGGSCSVYAMERVSTNGVLSAYTLPANGAPTAVTTGPDGALWFTEAGHNAIGRLTITGATTEYPLPSPNSAPAGIASGFDGALWFTLPGVNAIGRITTSGVITQYTLPTINSVPGGIAAGPDGALWFTESAANAIGRITTSGVVTEYPLPGGLAQATRIVSGPDGALWFTETVRNAIGRITTAGTITEYPLPAGNTTPAGIAGGPDGALWFVQRGSPNIGQAIIITNPVPPLLSVSVTHSGYFTQGQANAQYTVTVSNSSVATPTSGAVTVTEAIPPGLTLVSMAGPGWNCSGAACSRTDSLAPGASYPSITVTANVASTATSPQVNQVTVWGGGSPNANASDSTGISPGSVIPPGHPPFFTGESLQINGTYYLQFPNSTLFGFYAYLSGGFIYHFDLGYEFVLPSGDSQNGAYLWDYATGHWWFTSPTLFPYMYDFNLQAWIFYFADSARPGHYSTNPRIFANLSTHQVFTM